MHEHFVAQDSLEYGDCKHCGDLSDLASDAVEITNKGDTELRYDSGTGQFIANWETPTGQAGTCWQVTVTTQGGATISAFFELR
jgi:hypothetical protein